MKSLLLSLALCTLPGCAVYSPYAYTDPNVVYTAPAVQYYEPGSTYVYPPVYPYPYYGTYWYPSLTFSANYWCCSRSHFHHRHSHHGHSHRGHSGRGGHWRR